jgi:hypothetical protein
MTRNGLDSSIVTVRRNARALVLASCAAIKQEVIQQLGAQYVGKNVDVLVAQFGPPAATFKMNNGATSYQWQLSNLSIAEGRRGSATGQTIYCKLSVIAAPNGIISQLNTEDSDLMDGPINVGSICARRLGIERQA